MDGVFKLLFFILLLMSIAIFVLFYQQLNPISVSAATILNKSVTCQLISVANVKTPTVVYATSLTTNSLIQYNIQCTVLTTLPNISPTTFTLTVPSNHTPINYTINGNSVVGTNGAAVVGPCIVPVASTNNTKYTISFGPNDTSLHTFSIVIVGLLT